MSGKGKVVCVTGASGYIAGHIVAQLLEHGYNVRGTVRSLANAGYLTKLPAAKENLTLVEADLLKEGSFDEVVQGCDGVFHTASPFFRRQCQPEELIKPAVEGTLNVYRSCAKSPTVKRVVATSSFATIIFGHDHTTDPTPYTEEEWNEVSTIESGNTMHIYRVSKTEAEKAGWDFIKTQQPGFDIVTMNPPIVIGPWLPGYARENDSSMIIKEYLTGETKVAPDGGMGFIDVRDLAKAHIAAMETPKAQGRYLLASASLTFIDMARILKKMYPKLPITDKKAEGNAFKPEFNCAKIMADLDWSGRDVEETLKAQCDAVIAAGLVPDATK